jgi:hypothetical protein
VNARLAAVQAERHEPLHVALPPSAWESRWCGDSLPVIVLQTRQHPSRARTASFSSGETAASRSSGATLPPLPKGIAVQTPAPLDLLYGDGPRPSRIFLR